MTKTVELRFRGRLYGCPLGYLVVLTTGKWKIINENSESSLYLEVTTGTYTPYWAHENDLWIVETEEFVNECSNRPTTS